MKKKRKGIFLFLILMIFFGCNDKTAKEHSSETVQNENVDKDNNSSGIPQATSVGVAVSPVNPVVSSEKMLYVPDAIISPGFSPNIKIYDVSGDAPAWTKTISPSDLGGRPTGLALSPDNEKLYVAILNTSAVKVFSKNGTFNKLVTGTTFVDSRSLAVAPDGKRLYVVDAVADAVKVINVDGGNAAYIESIANISGSTNLYGVAVSPDNTMVAVTERALEKGKVYVYNIDHNENGTILYTQKAILDAVGYPSYVLFGAESDRIFVRVHEMVAPFADVIVYSWPVFKDSASISLVDKDEKDPMHAFGEILALSSNGQYLYLTHYRTTHDADETVSNDFKVHAYRISTVFYNDIANSWYLRTDWKYNADEYTYTDSGGKTFKVKYDDKFKNDMTPSKDGMSPVFDGSKIWFTCSEGGYYISSKWTGFVNASGILENPVPKAPTITHPAVGDNLVSYSGNASWSKPAGDTHTFVRYQIDYKEVGIDKWNVLDENADYDSIVFAADKFMSNKTYIIRVRMYGSMKVEGGDGFWGPYAYSPQWKMLVVP